MKSWNLSTLDVQARQPVVLDSTDEARLIAIELPAGEQLQEHQVHERAWLVVISGEITITGPNADDAAGGAGFVAEWDPAERHEVSAVADARVLLVLSPWPGKGHPSGTAA